MKRIKHKKKGFTLIELIVVMAVLAILVLLAAPRFIGQTKEAQFTKHISNARVLEDASERYYIDHGKWPRGADEDAYTPEQATAYADKIYDITGKELTLEEGKYWDIDYTALRDYAKLPDEDERANYILRNPVGKVYYLDGLSPVGENRNDQSYVTENTPIAVIGATAEEGSLQNGFYVGENINWNHTGSRSPNGSAIVAAEWEGKQEKYGETGTVRIGLRVQNELGFWSEWTYQSVRIKSEAEFAFENKPTAVIGAVAPSGNGSDGFLVGEKITWNYRKSTSPNGTTIMEAEWNNKKDTYNEKGMYRVGLRVRNNLGFWSDWTYQIVQIKEEKVAFQNYHRNAYDGNINTYTQSSGSLTWKGNLGGKTIKVISQAAYHFISYQKYDVNKLQFLDKDNQVISTLYAGGEGKADTRFYIVPVGTTSINIIIGKRFENSGYIYEISVLE